MTFVDLLLRDPALRPALSRLGVGEPASTVLVTPRFRTSRHVVALVLAGLDGEVVAVVKVPRLPTDTGGIDHEAAVLCELAARWSDGRVPEVLALGRWAGHPALVETAVTGRPLTHRLAAARPSLAAAQVAALLMAMPVVRRTTDEPGWFRRLVEAPVEVLAEAVQDDRLAALADRTLELARPLDGADLPLVLEHGDVTHPNVLLDPAAGAGLVDWELAEPAGLPGHDLLHFLAFLAFARAGVHDVAGQVRAFDDAFFGPSAWAARLAAEHLAARRVDPALLGPLVVTTWARYAAHLVPRLAQAGGPALVRDVVGRDRDVALWRHLVDVRAPDLAALGAAASCDSHIIPPREDRTCLAT